MSDQAKKPLHDDVTALSTIIQAGITVDTKASTATVADGLYKDNLPVGLTMEAVKTVSDYNSTFVAAGTHAMGMVAIEAMKSNKKLEKLSVDITMGVKDNLSITVDRVKEVPNRFGNGEAITKYGATSVTYEVKAGKNAGQLKSVRAELNALASAALAK